MQLFSNNLLDCSSSSNKMHQTSVCEVNHATSSWFDATPNLHYILSCLMMPVVICPNSCIQFFSLHSTVHRDCKLTALRWTWSPGVRVHEDQNHHGDIHLSKEDFITFVQNKLK